MAKKVLILTESFARGGMETHIEGEARCLSALGFEVHLACGSVDGDARLPAGLAGRLGPLPIGLDATAADHVAAADRLAGYIADQGIGVVHAHPFLAALPGFIAACRHGIPFVYSLHGPLSMQGSYGPWYDLILSEIILRHAGAVVCVSPEVALLARRLAPSDRLHVIPNAVAAGRLAAPPAAPGSDAWLLASRCDAHKLPGMLDFLRKAGAAGIARVDVAGDGPAIQDLERAIAQDHAVPPESPFPEVRLLGWRVDLPALMPSYAGVAGMGRVVLEAAAADRPVLLVGYDGVKGLLDRDLFEAAAFANFSGRNLPTVDAPALAAALRALAGEPDRFRPRSWVEGSHTEEEAWAGFLRIAADARPADRDLGQLLYDSLRLRTGTDAAALTDTELARTLGTILPSPDAQARLNGRLLAELRTEVAGLQVLRDDMRARCADLEGRIGTLSQDAAALRATSETLAADLGQARAERNAIAAELGQARAERDAAAAELGQTRAERDAAAAERDTAARDAAAVRGVASRARFETDRLRLELDAAVAEAIDLRRTVSSRQEECQAALERLAQAEQARDQAAAAFAETAAERDAAATALQEARAALARTREELGALSAAFEAAEADKVRLREEGQRLAVRFDELLSRLEILRTSQAWRIARGAKFVRERIMAGGLAERLGGTSALLGRLALRRPVSSFDGLKYGVDELRVVLDGLRGITRGLTTPGQVPPATPSGNGGAPRPCSGERGLVSIVLPIYNQAVFLLAAIDGVLAQSHRHWELIIVDDGSTDDFAAAVAPYLADPRIRVFTQPNQKLPSALNNGFQHARGAYLTWTSADNIMLPDQLARLVAALDANPQAGLAYSDYEAIDDRGQPLSDPSFRPHNRERPDSPLIRLPRQVTEANFHASGDNFLGASFLYRAEVADVVGRYDEGTFGGEDYDYWLRMHLATPFVHVPEILYRYRVHDNTLSARARELDLFANIRRLLAADAARRGRLLPTGLSQAAPQTGPQTGGGPWRTLDQFPAAAVAHRMVPYSALDAAPAGEVLAGEAPVVCVIDVPLCRIDPRRLAGAAVVVTDDSVAYFWLRGERHAFPQARVIFGTPAEAGAAIGHALALRSAEADGAGTAAAPRPPARLFAPPRPLHVLLCIYSWHHGGMEQVVLDLAAGLARRGMRVTVGLADDSPTAAVARLVGDRAKVVRFGGDAKAFGAFLDEEAVDVVSYHHTLLGAAEARRRGVATAYTFHNAYLWFAEERRQEWRAGLRDVDLFVAVSRQVAADALRRFDLDPSRIVVAPNGVDVPATADRAVAKAGAFTFLNVASFNRLKMQHALLHAFARVARRHPSCRLQLVGPPADPVYHREVLKLRRTLDLDDRVDIVPGLERAAVLDLMASAHGFVLPSCIEGWSIALMEAAMTGLPAIATDVGGARDLRDFGAPVRLVEPVVANGDLLDASRLAPVLSEGDGPFAARLAAAMEEALSAGPALCRQGGEQQADGQQADSQSVARLRARFSVDAMAERHAEAYGLARMVAAHRVQAVSGDTAAPEDRSRGVPCPSAAA